MILVYTLLVIIVLFCIMLLIKNEITFRNRCIIISSILAYQHDAIKHEEFSFDISGTDMEDYNKTLYRLWDWGYKRILPKEKYEIVKRYIEPQKEKKHD